MERFLITQSLLSSWSYMFNCYEESQEDAYNDFLRTLRREKSEPTDAMRDGIEFENECYRAAAHDPMRQPHKKWENGIQKVSAIIEAAPVQVKAQREIEVCGMTFLVYGILDALKAGTIYDVKYKVKSFGSLDLAGSYLDSPQHPAYLYMVPEAHEFKYLVSDGEDVYIETYTRRNTPDIGEYISSFVGSIQALNLFPLYAEHWQSR